MRLDNMFNARISRLIEEKKKLDDEIEQIIKNCQHSFKTTKIIETFGERDPREYARVIKYCEKCGFRKEYREDI
jgi:hypothetical protein